MTVQAKTYWVWTDKAKQIDPLSCAGDPVWPHIKKSAPKRYLDEGFIQESSDFIHVGQIILDI